MKKSLLPLALSAALCTGALMPSTVLAQASTSTTATKPKALSAGDKKFVKDASAAILLEQKYLELVKPDGPGTPETKKAAENMSTDLKKVWELLAAGIAEKGVDMAAEVDKADVAKIMKLKEVKPEKFDKELLKDLSKETKKTAKVFETAGKTVQDEELKKVATDWTEAIKKHDTDLEALEKELAAAKKK